MLSKEAKDVDLFQFSDPYGILNLNAKKMFNEEDDDSLFVEPFFAGENNYFSTSIK